MRALPAHEIEPLVTLYATGGSSLFDRDKFLAVGGFEEIFAPYGWEDVELSLRAWKQGYEIRYDPRSAIWHQFSSTIGSRIARRRAAGVYDRNRLLTHWLHLDTSRPRIAQAAAVAAKLLTNPLVGKFEYWPAFAQALSLREQVGARREELAKTQRRTLAEVVRKIEKQMSRAGIRALDDSSAPVRLYAVLDTFNPVQREASQRQ